MIDNITMRYSLSYDTDLEGLLKHIKNKYPSHFKEEINVEGVKSYRAEIKNLKLYINTSFIYITGSLNRFYLGNNIQVLSIQNIPKAFDTVSNSLNKFIDIREAYVTKMEIGVNLIMDHNCAGYIDKIHSASPRKATRFNDQTIDTSNGSRGMIIYDKTTEAKYKLRKAKQNIDIPNNLLRLEAKLKARHVFLKHFGSTLPTVSDIIDQMEKLPDIWYNEYAKLYKEYSVAHKPITTKKDFFNYTITKVGFDDCVYTINHSYNLGLIDKQNKDRYIKSVKDAFTSMQASSEGDLMKELDEKVNTWYSQAQMQ